MRRVNAVRRPGRRLGWGGGRSAFTPASISSLKLWLDERGQTVATGVSAWANQASLGGSFTQGTASAQPATGTTINGYAAPDGDGVNDVMNSTLTVGDVLTPAADHIFIVFKPTAIASHGILPYDLDALFTDATGGYTSISLQRDAGPLYYVKSYIYDGAVKQVAAGPFSLGSAVCVERSHGSGSQTLRFSGVDSTPTATGNMDVGAAVNTLRIFANYNATAFTDSAIATILVFNAQLSGANLTNVRSYLATKYGVAT